MFFNTQVPRAQRPRQLGGKAAEAKLQWKTTEAEEPESKAALTPRRLRKRQLSFMCQKKGQ